MAVLQLNLQSNSLAVFKKSLEDFFSIFLLLNIARGSSSGGSWEIGKRERRSWDREKSENNFFLSKKTMLRRFRALRESDRLLLSSSLDFDSAGSRIQFQFLAVAIPMMLERLALALLSLSELLMERSDGKVEGESNPHQWTFIFNIVNSKKKAGWFMNEIILWGRLSTRDSWAYARISLDWTSSLSM